MPSGFWSGSVPRACRRAKLPPNCAYRRPQCRFISRPWSAPGCSSQSAKVGDSLSSSFRPRAGAPGVPDGGLLRRAPGNLRRPGFRTDQVMWGKEAMTTDRAFNVLFLCTGNSPAPSWQRPFWGAKAGGASMPFRPAATPRAPSIPLLSGFSEVELQNRFRPL